MAKTDGELKAVVPGNTCGTDSHPMCIRLKLPPQERNSSCGGGRGSENGMAEDLSQNQGNRVREESRELAEEVGTELSSSSSDDEKPQQCGVCRKKFPSRKSIYDHMRLHPDRGSSQSKGVMKRKARELDHTCHGRRAKKAAGNASGRASAASHTCSRCHKSFPCFQALGGHRSSCNKTKQSTTAGQASDANMPGMWSWQPRLDLSLSLSRFTPDPSTSDVGFNNTTGFHPNMNEPPSTEESEDNEPNMIKFL